MAQVILCDAHNMEHPADWLVTHMADGEAQAYCDDGYRELMVSTVEAMNAAEIDQTAAEAEARLAAVHAPDPTIAPDGASDTTAPITDVSEPVTGDTEPATAKAITRELADGLTALGMDPAEAERFAADSTAAQLAKPQGTEPAHVVRRGQSQKARQHQAAQELRAEREAATATAGPQETYPANETSRLAAAVIEDREAGRTDDAATGREARLAQVATATAEPGDDDEDDDADAQEAATPPA